MIFKKFFSYFLASLILLSSVLPYSIDIVHAQAPPPQSGQTSIVGSNINPCSPGSQTCNVTAPSGGNEYFYTGASGCGVGVSAADFVQDLQITEDGTQCVSIGHSSSNTGTINSNGASYQGIGGIGVTGMLSETLKFENNGSNTISGNFNLPQDSLVVLASSSSGRVLSPISLSAPFTVDQQSTQGSSLGIILAHATLAAGAQQFTLTYSTDISSIPSNVIGVVLYIFPSSSVPSTISPYSQSSTTGGTVASIQNQLPSNCPTTGAPTVDNDSIAGSESLTLDPRSCEYFFIGSTAGGASMNSISWNPDLNVAASYSGNLAISIGNQVSNTGSYNSQAGNHGIAGVGVSGFGSYDTFTAFTPNSDTLSTAFSTNSNDLVLILVGGEGDGNLTLSGIRAQTLVDQTYSEAGSNVIASEAIYESQLPAGTYNVNVQSITYPTNSGTSLGIVVYVFHSSGSNSSLSSSQNTSLSLIPTLAFQGNSYYVISPDSSNFKSLLDAKKSVECKPLGETQDWTQQNLCGTPGPNLSLGKITEITGIGEICVAKDGSLFLVDAVSDSLATQVLDLLNDLLSKEAPVCDSSFQALQKLLGNSYNEEEYVDAHISGLVCVNDIQSESCTPVYRLTTINTERSAQNSTEQSIVIPSWIKNNAKWWSNKQISDSEFIKGIQYLVQNGVLKVPQASSGNIKQQSLPVMAPTNVNPNSSNEGLNFHGQLIKNADTDDYSFILNMIPSSSSQRIYYMWSDSQGEALIHDIYSQLQQNGFTVSSTSHSIITIATTGVADTNSGKMIEDMIACSNEFSNIIHNFYDPGGYEGAILSTSEIIQNTASGSPCGDNEVTELWKADSKTLEADQSNIEQLIHQIPNNLQTTQNNQPYQPDIIIGNFGGGMQTLNISIDGLTPPSQNSVTLNYEGDFDYSYQVPSSSNQIIDQPFNTSDVVTISSSSASANNPCNSAMNFPSWTKNIAKWWSEGLVGDADFVNLVQYLINQGILNVC